MGLDVAMPHQDKAKRRRERQSDTQGRQDRENIGQPQGTEQSSGQPGHDQNGHEDQGIAQRRIYHRASDLQ